MNNRNNINNNNNIDILGVYIKEQERKQATSSTPPNHAAVVDNELEAIKTEIKQSIVKQDELALGEAIEKANVIGTSMTEQGKTPDVEFLESIEEGKRKLDYGFTNSPPSNIKNGRPYSENGRQVEPENEAAVANAEAKEGVNPAAAASPEETAWSKEELLDAGWNKELVEKYVQKVDHGISPKEAYREMREAAKLARQKEAEETAWSKEQLLDARWNKELAEKYVQKVDHGISPKEAYREMREAAAANGSATNVVSTDNSQHQKTDIFEKKTDIFEKKAQEALKKFNMAETTTSLRNLPTNYGKGERLWKNLFIEVVQYNPPMRGETKEERKRNVDDYDVIKAGISEQDYRDEISNKLNDKYYNLNEADLNEFKNWIEGKSKQEMSTIGKQNILRSPEVLGGGGRKKTRRNQNRKNQKKRKQSRKTQNKRKQNKRKQNKRKQSRKTQSRKTQNKRNQSRKRRN